MRWNRLWIAGLLVGLLGTSTGLPQTGGPGKSGFQSDPNERFNQYTNGKEVWLRSEITDPRTQSRFDMMAQQLGVTNGAITRQQYLEFSKQMMERFGGMQLGGPSGMGGPGGPSGAPAAPTITMTPSSYEGSGRRGGSDSDGGRRVSGGTMPGGMTEFLFRRLDRDGDGVLSNDEIPEQLRADRSRYDNNGDGFIDANEFRAYMENRMQQMQAERDSTPGGSPFDMASMLMNRMSGENDSGSSFSFDRGGYSRSRQDDPSRPVVYRPGNLPRELPAWFTQRDTDRDGQIGLYEWRASGEPLDVFYRLDANNDGFVTAEEVLRSQTENTAASGGGTDGGFTAFRGNRGSDRGGNGFSGITGLDPNNLPFDRDQLMRMRDTFMQGGGQMPNWMGNRSSSGDGGPPSGGMTKGGGSGKGGGPSKGGGPPSGGGMTKGGGFGKGGSPPSSGGETRTKGKGR